MQSHFEGETWGLSFNDGFVITSGDDNRIMMIDAQTRQYVRGGKISDKKMKDPARKSNASTLSQMPPNKQARAVTFTKKHSHLVVCNNLGKVSIRDLEDFDKKICSLKEAKDWCEVARYSPCENFLAIGSHDKNIHIYKVDADTHSYSLHWSVQKGSSFVNALDWTVDSKEVRISTGDYEVLYFDVENKEFLTNGGESAANKLWASNSIKNGPDRKGLQPSGEDRTHINDVAGSQDANFVLTADDFGLVNVFHWPEPNISAARSYAAHSEHVARIVISSDNTRVFSVGGQDKTLI